MNAVGRMLLIPALIVVVAACGATGSDTDRIAELEQQVSDLQDQTGVTTAVTTPAPTSAVTTPAPTSAVTTPAPTSAPESRFTRAEENAIGSAESYLGFTAFSRSGLIDQLEYEGFTNAEATLAVDYLDVDWNKQAALSAEQYLDFSSFSRSGLIDQLLYEGFTQSQATYGVDETGL